MNADNSSRMARAITGVHGALDPDFAAPTVSIKSLSVIRGQKCEGIALPSTKNCNVCLVFLPASLILFVYSDDVLLGKRMILLVLFIDDRVFLR